MVLLFGEHRAAWVHPSHIKPYKGTNQAHLFEGQGVNVPLCRALSELENGCNLLDVVAAHEPSTSVASRSKRPRLNDAKEMELERMLANQELRKQFWMSLHQVLHRSGCSITKYPIIQRRPVDLYALYCRVINLGGVNVIEPSDRRWHKYWVSVYANPPFNIDYRRVTDAGAQFGKLYHQFLHEYAQKFGNKIGKVEGWSDWSPGFIRCVCLDTHETGTACLRCTERETVQCTICRCIQHVECLVDMNFLPPNQRVKHPYVCEMCGRQSPMRCTPPSEADDSTRSTDVLSDSLDQRNFTKIIAGLRKNNSKLCAEVRSQNERIEQLVRRVKEAETILQMASREASISLSCDHPVRLLVDNAVVAQRRSPSISSASHQSVCTSGSASPVHTKPDPETSSSPHSSPSGCLSFAPLSIVATLSPTSPKPDDLPNEAFQRGSFGPLPLNPRPTRPIRPIRPIRPTTPPITLAPIRTLGPTDDPDPV